MRCKTSIAIGLAVVLTTMPARAECRTAASSQAGAMQAELAQAYVSNSAEAVASKFVADGRFLPDFQPAMKGADRIAAYWQTMSARRRVLALEFRSLGQIDLGNALMAFGVYNETRQRPSRDPETVLGKYVHVWRCDSTGTLKLQAEARGYGSVWPDPAEDYVATITPVASDGARPLAHDEIGLELERINALIAASVRSHDLTPRLPLFAEDFVFMPYGEMPRIGKTQVIPFLTAYVRDGSGATFDKVDVYNDGYEAHGKYIVEYAKFLVDWRVGNASGRVTGGGIRLWERTSSGPLILKVEIGTHDFKYR